MEYIIRPERERVMNYKEKDLRGEVEFMGEGWSIMAFVLCLLMGIGGMLGIIFSATSVLIKGD